MFLNLLSAWSEVVIEVLFSYGFDECQLFTLNAHYKILYSSISNIITQFSDYLKKIF